MKYQIRKYTRAGDDYEIEWSAFDRVLHVAPQSPMDEWPTIWTEHCLDAEQTSAKVVILPTGGVFDDDAPLLHVGTSIHLAGRLVWHLYLVTED